MPSNKVRTRFAPSPTGYMHVGNLRTALYTLSTRSFLKQISKLSFQYTIRVFSFLFLTKLNTILRSFSSFIDAMLSRGIVLFCKNFIGAKNSFAEFTSDFCSRSGISCHF